MKRKILVSLLALTLALSLMPMMAFADDGTEDHAPANETKVDSEDVLSRKAMVTEITSGNKPVPEPKKAAGKRGTQICTHPSEYVFKYYEYDEAECTIFDRGDYHEVTGEIWEVTHCRKCKEDLDSEYLGYRTVTERHYYEDGECWICYHLNTCPHPPMEYYYAYQDDDEYTVIDRGDYHEVNGWIDKVTYCSVCGDRITAEVFEKKIVEEAHSFNIGGVCEECDHLDDKTRLYGDSRYDTAVTVANRYKTISDLDKFENVVVACGLNYPDALSGGYLAKVKNAPIILVKPSEEDYIANYIDKNIESGGTVYLLGGTGVVSSSFENKIRAKGENPIRLGGEDRYETNLMILEEAGVDDEEILVCTGTGFADSLSASAVGKPILLVDSNLTDAQKDYINRLNAEQFYLIGGEGAVMPEIKSDLISLEISEDNIKRIAGETRYGTSTEVARKFFTNPQTVVLAYAQNFPDGLSGGPFAMRQNAPIILTDSSRTEEAKSYVKSVGATSNFTLGGPSLISERAVDVIMGN